MCELWSIFGYREGVKLLGHHKPFTLALLATFTREANPDRMSSASLFLFFVTVTAEVVDPCKKNTIARQGSVALRLLS